jgi:hypothetical protein
MVSFPALESLTISFTSSFQHASSNWSRCLISIVERALGWELIPRGPVCATDSFWHKTNHDPFMNLSFLICYTRHLRWGDLKVQAMVLLILLHLSDQSHSHSIFLHGAHPFSLIAGCWIAVQEHLKHWNIRLKLIRHNRTCRWLLFLQLLAPGILHTGRCSQATAAEYSLWTVAQKSNFCK